MSKPVPSQGDDLMEGVYQTPLELLRPINQRWPLVFDLAANEQNSVMLRLHGHAGLFFSETMNSLERPWVFDAYGFSWCNPPYGDIGAWTDKAYAEAKRGAKIVMLLPSATGASWLTPCWEAAHIVLLVGRPIFEFLNPMTHKNPAKRGKPNTDPYGKDMLLAVFGQGTGTSRWDWRKS